MDKKELIKKYEIDIEKLKKEQLELSKKLDIKDRIDFSLVERFGAVHTIFVQNKILCGFIVCNNEFEIIDSVYVFNKVNFPYLPGFRAYRELPAIVEAFSKLKEVPDVIFVSGSGILHPRLGLASHLSLSINVPTIGISNVATGCDIEGEDVLKESKKVGKVITKKPGSKPIYVSPGNFISIKSAYELSKKNIFLPHKNPEPLHLFSKYIKKIKKELI